MAGYPRQRLRAAAVVAGLLALAVLAMGLDARARSGAVRAGVERTASIAHATGLSDLALSTHSSWLRHPALAVPSSGASDAPGGLDVDPAGAVIARQGAERPLTIRAEAP